VIGNFSSIKLNQNVGNEFVAATSSVFWDVTLHCLEKFQKYLSTLACYPENRDSHFLRNIGTHLTN